MQSPQHILGGLWKPQPLRALHYGPGCVKEHLIETLPTESSNAFIITTSSLASKTSIISTLEKQLGSKHAGTFSHIGQHAPVADLDKATEKVLANQNIDTVISVGGGSPIDSAKAISFRGHQKGNNFLFHICIPTTLSAAECTNFAGYTNEKGMKTGLGAPGLAPNAIFYDATFAVETPPRLWLSTGMRAMDHAIETMYHPNTPEVPTRWMALGAAGELFKYLPKYKDNPKDQDVITRCQLAAYASLGFMGQRLGTGLGLSHTMGYALGSPYQIPHGITSCLTLGHVVKLKAQESDEIAEQIARMAPFIGIKAIGDKKMEAEAVGQAILDLVEKLDLKTSLTKDHGVGQDQLPIITKIVTKQESGPDYDAVAKIVESLY